MNHARLGDLERGSAFYRYDGSGSRWSTLRWEVIRHDEESSTTLCECDDGERRYLNSATTVLPLED